MKGKMCVIHWTWEQRGREGPSRWSAAERRMRLGAGLGEVEGEVKI